MKTTNYLLMILQAGVIAVAGCTKAQPPPQPTTVNGMRLDVSKLRQAFADASPTLQRSVSAVTMPLRYGQKAEALAALEKLASSPDLTEPQKKAANELLEQLRQAVNQAPAKPAQ